MQEVVSQTAPKILITKHTVKPDPEGLHQELQPLYKHVYYYK